MTANNTSKPGAPRPFSGPHFQTNQNKAGGWQCCPLCGRAVTTIGKWARVVDGGSRFAAESERGADFDDDMGFWPVGSDCARQFPAEYLWNDCEE